MGAMKKWFTEGRTRNSCDAWNPNDETIEGVANIYRDTLLRMMKTFSCEVVRPQRLKKAEELINKTKTQLVDCVCEINMYRDNTKGL